MACTGRAHCPRGFVWTAGAGGYGLVKRATHKETGLAVAIKILKLPDKLTAAAAGKENSKGTGRGKARASPPRRPLCGSAAAQLMCPLLRGLPFNRMRSSGGGQARCFTAAGRGSSRWTPKSTSTILLRCESFSLCAPRSALRDCARPPLRCTLCALHSLAIPGYLGSARGTQSPSQAFWSGARSVTARPHGGSSFSARLDTARWATPRRATADRSRATLRTQCRRSRFSWTLTTPQC